MGERLSVKTRVSAVRLLEDRAHVERRGSIDLPLGLVKLSVENIAPVLSDKSLSVRVLGPGSAQVQDVRVRRSIRILRKDRVQELRNIESKIEALEQDQRSFEAQRAAQTSDLESVQQVSDLALAEMAEDASWGSVDAEWSARLQKLGARARELREELVHSEYELERTRETLGFLQAQRSNLLTAGSEVGAILEAELTVASAGQYELVVTYVVPGACWRPYHRATLTNVESTTLVAFECQACVWQNTGEDWLDAELSFSTERPSLGTEPPLLSTDLIAVQRKSAQLQVEAREEQIEQVGLGAGVSETKSIPGIDDGGQTMELKSKTKANILSDGRPYRVSLFEFESAAETELVVTAELAQAAIIRTVQTNSARFPLLAGPTDLVRNGGISGRSRVLFIAPGEKFELGWGPEGSIRVQRQEEPVKEETSRLTGTTTSTRRLKIYLSNLGPHERRVHVRERVPVSEIDKVQIQVDADETTSARQPDSNGFLDWNVVLPAYGHDKLELKYALKKHSDVTGTV